MYLFDRIKVWYYNSITELIVSNSKGTISDIYIEVNYLYLTISTICIKITTLNIAVKHLFSWKLNNYAYNKFKYTKYGMHITFYFKMNHYRKDD